MWSKASFWLLLWLKIQVLHPVSGFQPSNVAALLALNSRRGGYYLSKDMPKVSYYKILNTLKSHENDDFEEPPPPILFDDMDYSQEDLESLTVSQLRQQLRLRGLKLGGKKSELISRLLGEQKEHEQDEDLKDIESTGQRSNSEAKEFARSRGKELIDVTDFLDEEDKGKETKTLETDEHDDVDENTDSNKSDSPETWGEEAKIIEDYEGRAVIVDNLSRTVVQFKGSQSSKVEAYVVASRDSLKQFLAGGGQSVNATDPNVEVKNMQLAREKVNKVPLRLEDQQGDDVDDEEGLYTKVLDRDYGDWGSYSMTGVQLSAQEVKGVLLLSDIYGPFNEDTKMLAEKIAFECQPVVVFAPDLFRGSPWVEEGESGLNKEGQSYEEWRLTHSDQRVSVDIRAAAAVMREKYGVSSISLFGQCYGGGRALEATARLYPQDTTDDVDGNAGPPHVDPSTCIAWYPTRYDAELLFGDNRARTDERNMKNSAIMAIFAENDIIPGATPDDAKKLKKCLESDTRVKDFMVKIFPGQHHGFAHVGMSKQEQERDEFLEEEFGGPLQFHMDSSDAEVASLLSTAWMETYARMFLPTIGEAVKDDSSWSDLRMPEKPEVGRNVREEIEDALENHQDVELDLSRMHPDEFNSPFDDLAPNAINAQPFGLSLEDDADTFLDKLEAAIDNNDVDYLPGIGNVPLDESSDLGQAYW